MRQAAQWGEKQASWTWAVIPILVLLCSINVFACVTTFVLNPKGAEGNVLPQTRGDGIGGGPGRPPFVILRALTCSCSGPACHHCGKVLSVPYLFLASAWRLCFIPLKGHLDHCSVGETVSLSFFTGKDDNEHLFSGWIQISGMNILLTQAFFFWWLYW